MPAGLDDGRIHVAHALERIDPGRLHDLVGELVGDDVEVAGLRPVIRGGSRNPVEAVGDRRRICDGAIGRDGPGRRRPDHHAGGLKVRDRGGIARRAQLHLSRGIECVDRELDPYRARLVLVVLDFRFSQGRALDNGPHDGLRPAIKLAGHGERHQLGRDLRLGGERHRRIGMSPVALDAQALELLALDTQPMLGERTAFTAELDDGNLVLVLPLRAVFFLDLPLDRQAVAVPSRHVVRIVPEHLLRPGHEILQDLVERVADVDVAICIGWAVVQHELRTTLRSLAQASIEVHVGPAREHLRLALRQARAHGKIGLRQEQRLGIVAGSGSRLRIGGRSLVHGVNREWPAA